MSFEDVFKRTYGKSIYINRLMFDHECEPHEFPHRENEMEYIAELMNPILTRQKPTNAVIIGSASTGKTTAMKRILEEIEKRTQKTVCIHLNCQIISSKREIYIRIHEKIFGHGIDQNRIATDNILKTIAQYLQKNKKGLILVLDDVDFLFHKKEAKMLNEIMKMHEEYKGVRTGLYLIISQNEFKYKLDEKIESMFIPTKVYFKEYTKEQLFDILKERCELGFVKGAISDNQLKEVVNYSVNIRDGLSILMQLGDMGEKEGSISIKDEYLDLILEKLIK